MAAMRVPETADAGIPKDRIGVYFIEIEVFGLGLPPPLQKQA